VHALLPGRRGEEAAKQFKLGIEVLERRDMEKLGMGALLA
jgi:leucyl aminopeptidase